MNTVVDHQIQAFRDQFQLVRDEISRVIVGNDEIISGVMTCLLARGHALLEGMQENSVSAAGRTHALDQPFFVLATQNPIEMEGTYPLPEAQMDRFFFKLKLDFPDVEQLHLIVDRTTGQKEPAVQRVLQQGEILEMRETARAIP